MFAMQHIKKIVRNFMIGNATEKLQMKRRQNFMTSTKNIAEQMLGQDNIV